MHIPRKLSVTVKMLTPFSKKRVDRSGIEALKNNKFKSQSAHKLNNRKSTSSNTVAVPWKSSECLGKAAHLQIGSVDKRNAQHVRANTLKNKQNKNNNNDSNNSNEWSSTHRGGDQLPHPQKVVKISPYRNIEGGGRSNTQKQCLSPIHEFSGTPSTFCREQSYVHWYGEN